MVEDESSVSDRRVISSLTIGHMAQHFYSGAPILYQSIREELGLSVTQIGLMAATTSILGGFVQIGYNLASRLVGRRLLLTFSSLLMSAGSFLMGVSFRFESLILGNAMAGLGTAGIHPVSSSIIAQKWMKRKVGMALSLFYGLGYLGNIIGPLVLSAIALWAGWRFSYYLIAATFLGCGILAFFMLRGERAAERSTSKQSSRFVDDIKSAIRIRDAMLIIAAQAFISGGTGMGVMTTWVPLFIRDPSKGLGLDVWTAGLVSSIAMSGGVIGTILFGRIGDRIGYLKTAMFSLTLTTTAILLLNFEDSFSIIVVPHLFILSMTTFSMTSILQAHMAEVSTTAQREILLGLYFTVGQGVSALWSTLLGYLVELFSYKAIWVTMVFAGIGAMTCLVTAHKILIKNRQLETKT